MDWGLVFQAEDYERVSPSRWALNDVTLSTPESGNEVAWIRKITWLSESDRASALIHQPKLQAAQLGAIWHLIHDQFLCRPERTAVPFQLSANDLRLEPRGLTSLNDALGSALVETEERLDKAETQPGLVSFIVITRFQIIHVLIVYHSLFRYRLLYSSNRLLYF